MAEEQPGIDESSSIEDLHHLRLMALLDEQVREKGARRAAADLGVPYSALLYERLLGRPFASHRDSVSELVGDILENAIEEVMSRNRISYRKTKRAERLPVIVDEALVNFDPTRGTRAAGSFIDLSETNQVLVFTCHPQVVDWFVGEAAQRGAAEPEVVRI